MIHINVPGVSLHFKFNDNLARINTSLLRGKGKYIRTSNKRINYWYNYDLFINKLCNVSSYIVHLIAKTDKFPSNFIGLQHTFTVLSSEDVSNILPFDAKFTHLTVPVWAFKTVDFPSLHQNIKGTYTQLK